MVYILSNFENSESRYKEVPVPMSGYKGQSKGARFTYLLFVMQGVYQTLKTLKRI